MWRVSVFSESQEWVGYRALMNRITLLFLLPVMFVGVGCERHSADSLPSHGAHGGGHGNEHAAPAGGAGHGADAKDAKKDAKPEAKKDAPAGQAPEFRTTSPK